MIAARIIFCILMIAVFYLLFRKKLAKTLLISFVFLLLLTGIVSERIVQGIPNLQDTIMIKADASKNESSSGYEIRLSGFTIDSRTRQLGKTRTGKWFWLGDDYCWRSQEDFRQPKGVTSSITVDIPVGRDRTVNFHTSPSSGKVIVRIGEELNTVDLYSSQPDAISAIIPSSSMTRIMLNEGLHLLAYAIVYTLLWLTVYIFLRYKATSPIRLKKSLFTHWDTMLLVTVAGLTLIVLIKYSIGQSFWIDEIAQLGYVSMDSLRNATLQDVNMPPFYTMILFFWYRIVPYGEEWLLLPSELFVVGAVWVTGLCGRKLFGPFVGVLSSFFLAINAVAIMNCAYELRSYGLLLFLFSLLLYQYISRYQTDGVSTRREAKYWLTLTAAFYTHYFGLFVSCVFFLLDCWQVLRKKKNRTYLAAYALAFVAYLPWIIVVLERLLATTQSNTFLWQPTPTLTSIVSLFQLLQGNLPLAQILCLVGFACIIIRSYTRKGHDVLTYRTSGVLILLPIFLVGTVYLYDLYLAPLIHLNITFWVERYFSELTVPLCILSALGLFYLLRQFNHQNGGKLRNETTLILLVPVICVLTLNAYSTLHSVKNVPWGTENQPYSTAAEWLYTRDDIYNKTTLVLFNGDETYQTLEGWSDFYLTKKGVRDPILVRYDQMISADDLDQYDTIYYFCLHWTLDSLLTDFTQTEYVDIVKVRVYQRS